MDYDLFRKQIDRLVCASVRVGVDMGMNGEMDGRVIWGSPSDALTARSNHVSMIRSQLQADFSLYQMALFLKENGFETEDIEDELASSHNNWACKNATRRYIPNWTHDLDDYFVGLGVNYRVDMEKHVSGWDKYMNMDWNQQKISRDSFDYIPGDNPRKMINSEIGKHVSAISDLSKKFGSYN